MRVSGRWRPTERPHADVRSIIKMGRLGEASIRGGKRAELAIAYAGWRGLPCVAARRVSARLPSNFLLLAQKKVTKEECPNTSHLACSLRLHAYFNGSGSRTFSELLQRFPRSGSNMRFRYASSLSGPRCGFSCQSLCSSPVAEAWSPNGWCSGPLFGYFFWPRRKSNSPAGANTRRGATHSTVSPRKSRRQVKESSVQI
jgi:hypothetical protein